MSANMWSLALICDIFDSYWSLVFCTKCRGMHCPLLEIQPKNLDVRSFLLSQLFNDGAIIELYPGSDGEPISCSTHAVDLHDPPKYEAISYVWGDTSIKSTVSCDGGILIITTDLYKCLLHLRYLKKSRFLWVDALCLNQSNIPERGHQVGQMKSIYERAEKILAWLGPSTEKGDAERAIEAIRQISDFLCETLSFSLAELPTKGNVYREVLYDNRDRLPLPNESEFSTEATWSALAWFYFHPYFNRVSVVQEINSNENRTVYCGLQTVEWERVELVAGYLILEPAFTSQYGFTATHCWWAATLTTERIRAPKNWVSMLYLASNFSSVDPRDMIYGLHGFLKYSDTTGLLEPDYSKSLLEVYRDSVEAAFFNFHNADILLYVTGNESPSWIPRWDRPMLFRNPFRLGNALPWKPTGDTEPEWNIDRSSNILTVRGSIAGTIKFVEPYNQKVFGNATLDSEGAEREVLKHTWEGILSTASKSQAQLPLSRTFLSSAAICFAFGLDENSDIAVGIVHTFVAYLRLALDDETSEKYIPLDLASESAHKDGRAFGKPVWDFEYPESSFFITENGLVGCSISSTAPGDIVGIVIGCTYPLVFRPAAGHFFIRGYAYVDGVMKGEMKNPERQDFTIC